MAEKVVIVSFQSLSEKGGRGIGRIGYDLADYYHGKGIDVVYHVITKGPHSTPFPSESSSSLTRYLLFAINWLFRKKWVSNTWKRRTEERLFDFFMSQKNLTGDYLIATTPFLGRTLGKHKSKFKKVILIPANPNEHFIAQILEKEIAIYGLSKYEDPYTSQSRQEAFAKGIRYFDQVVAISDITKRSYVQESVPVLKLPYVFIPSVQQTHRQPSTKKDKMIFLYVAHSVLLKGLHRLLAVWKELANEPLELWIVGSIAEDYKKAFDMNFEATSNVKYMGRPDNEGLNRMFADCDTVIVPSLIDNEPTTVIEALTNERPVLVSEYCGYADLIRQFEPQAIFDIMDHDQTKATIMNFYKRYSEITVNFGSAYSYVKKKEFDSASFYESVLNTLENK